MIRVFRNETSWVSLTYAVGHARGDSQSVGRDTHDNKTHPNRPKIACIPERFSLSRPFQSSIPSFRIRQQAILDSAIPTVSIDWLWCEWCQASNNNATGIVVVWFIGFIAWGIVLVHHPLQRVGNDCCRNRTLQFFPPPTTRTRRASKRARVSPLENHHQPPATAKLWAKKAPTRSWVPFTNLPKPHLPVKRSNLLWRGMRTLPNRLRRTTTTRKKKRRCP